MNRYPLWKYLVMIAAVLIGLFYTVPNIFPQVPAVQVSTNKTAVKLDASLLERVEKTLKGAGLAVASSELDVANGVHVRFAKGDFEAQSKAKDLLIKDLNQGNADGTGNYIIALTNESTTPHWMQSLNAKPMALGLDLRGGVHFLMQVDMKGALDRAADRNASDVRTLLREKRIQYNGLDKAGDTIVLKFSEPAEREKASAAISTSNADLLIKESGAAQDLSLIVTLKEDAKRKLADAAIEQNQ
ncbi:MAG TPA: protein translocase subunit SecD, partial [Casimicrobium sp.]|nr:protein translocase subunit SecD [Casimicrobium sp.]